MFQGKIHIMHSEKLSLSNKEAVFYMQKYYLYLNDIYIEKVFKQFI